MSCQSALMKVKENPKFWTNTRTQIEEKSSNRDASSCGTGDMLGFPHFRGISSHFLFWLWDRVKVNFPYKT
ncbi:unnamed protein product, partial [Staurois parvus]